MHNVLYLVSQTTGKLKDRKAVLCQRSPSKLFPLRDIIRCFTSYGISINFLSQKVVNRIQFFPELPRIHTMEQETGKTERFRSPHPNFRG